MWVSELIAGLLFVTPVQAESPNVKSAECLAMNMYHEARGQGVAGVLAVSFVVLNRVKDNRFPNTICEVVEDGPVRESWKTRKDKNLSPIMRKYYPIKHRCQFSWWCDGISDVPKDKKTYQKLLKISQGIIDQKYPLVDITDGALFYHADYVTPSWAKTKVKTVEIQDHIFYRWETK
jgi:N-acetylmuramoyl-L-alanine amidase